jgi:hypothetical protein
MSDESAAPLELFLAEVHHSFTNLSVTIDIYHFNFPLVVFERAVSGNNTFSCHDREDSMNRRRMPWRRRGSTTPRSIFARDSTIRPITIFMTQRILTPLRHLIVKMGILLAETVNSLLSAVLSGTTISHRSVHLARRRVLDSIRVRG